MDMICKSCTFSISSGCSCFLQFGYHRSALCCKSRLNSLREWRRGWLKFTGKKHETFFFLKSINAYKRPIFCILYKSRVSLLWRFVCGLYKCPVFGVVNSIASTLEDTNKVATAMLRQRVELEKCWLFFNLVEARTSFDDKQHIAFSMQCVLSAWLLNPPRTDGRFPLSAATMLEALAPIGELHSSKELSGVGRAEMSESWVHGSINSDFRPLWYHWNSLDSRSPPSLSLCFCLYPLKLRPLKFSWCNAFGKKTTHLLLQLVSKRLSIWYIFSIRQELAGRLQLSAKKFDA